MQRNFVVRWFCATYSNPATGHSNFITQVHPSPREEASASAAAASTSTEGHMQVADASKTMSVSPADAEPAEMKKGNSAVRSEGGSLMKGRFSVFGGNKRKSQVDGTYSHRASFANGHWRGAELTRSFSGTETPDPTSRSTELHNPLPFTCTDDACSANCLACTLGASFSTPPSTARRIYSPPQHPAAPRLI